MVLYFSGTGNSEYVAKKIAAATGDKTINLFKKIKAHSFSSLYSERPWVIVAPTYAWRIPRILNEWIEKAELEGSKDIYFVMTCGGSIGNADKYLAKLCKQKKLNYYGVLEIIMPENYIAMFSTPTQAESLQIIQRANARIDKAIKIINSREKLSSDTVTFKDKLSSGIINNIFYPAFVHAKKFYATDECTSCGKCVELCPLKNIFLGGKKPSWGKECTHCMACICRCPNEAIEYGEHSKGLTRYVCPKN